MATPHKDFTKHFRGKRKRISLIARVFPDRVVLAVAKACPKDSWSRSAGHLIATNRLKNRKRLVRGRYTLSVKVDPEKKFPWKRIVALVPSAPRPDSDKRLWKFVSKRVFE